MCSILIILSFYVLVLSSVVFGQAPLPGRVIGACEPDRSVASNITRLCGQCSQWRRLPDNYKPPMLQEVLCQRTAACLQGSGSCAQRYAKVVVVMLQANGQTQEQTLQVAAGCECRATNQLQNARIDDQPVSPHCSQSQHADGSLDLCSTCTSDVLIGNEYLPRTIQQVQCGNQRCLGGAGQCRPYSINMNLVQRVNNGLVDVQRQVTVGCDCWVQRPGSRLKALLKRQTLN